MAALARIILRYGAGFLIAKGFLDKGTGDMLAVDPDIQLALAAGLMILSEGWYWLAKRMGWST